MTIYEMDLEELKSYRKFLDSDQYLDSEKCADADIDLHKQIVDLEIAYKEILLSADNENNN
jgi:hypothetical protein